jgi:short-subunit dehydrogenase
MQITGSTVALTGASGGLGHAIARDLHARGATLLLIGRREDLLAELAGIPAAGFLQSFTVEEIDKTLDVNLRAPIALAQALLPAMLERGRGHLLFMSSIGGKTAVPGDSLYHATKYGLRGFAAGLRADLHGTGVGVSCVLPGFIRDAGIFADSDVKLPPGTGTRSPQDVARAVARAIERDVGEVEVASVPQRVGVLLSAFSPELSARTIRLLGGREVARQMGEALREKR